MIICDPAPALTLRFGTHSGSSTQHITLLATFHIYPVDNIQTLKLLLSDFLVNRLILPNCSCLGAYYVPSRHWPSLQPTGHLGDWSGSYCRSWEDRPFREPGRRNLLQTDFRQPTNHFVSSDAIILILRSISLQPIF